MGYVDEDSGSNELSAELNKSVAKHGLTFELLSSDQVHGVDLVGLLDGREVRIEVRGLFDAPGHSKRIIVFDAVTQEILGSGSAEGELKDAFANYRWSEFAFAGYAKNGIQESD